MDKAVKTILVVYIIAVLVGLVAMYIYLQMSDSFIKAQKYDYYHEYIEQIENCTTPAAIYCSNVFTFPSMR